MTGLLAWPAEAARQDGLRAPWPARTFLLRPQRAARLC